jgi:hypothetical protein
LKDPVATCKVDGIDSYTKSFSTLGESDNCGSNDCLNVMKQEGVETVSYNTTSKSCVGTLNCGFATGTKEKCGSCPLGDNKRCCLSSSGVYSGLVCEKSDSICTNQGGVYQCVKGYGFKNSGKDENVYCAVIDLDDTTYSTNNTGMTRLYTDYDKCEADAKEYSNSDDRCAKYSDQYLSSLAPPTGAGIPYNAPAVVWEDETTPKNTTMGAKYGGKGPWFVNDGSGRCIRTGFYQALKQGGKDAKWIATKGSCTSNNMSYSGDSNCWENGPVYPNGSYQCGLYFTDNKSCPTKFAWKKCTKEGGCKTQLNLSGGGPDCGDFTPYPMAYNNDQNNSPPLFCAKDADVVADNTPICSSSVTSNCWRPGGFCSDDPCNSSTFTGFEKK